VHPLHTEAVNNISFREDLIVCLLLPACWLLYRGGERGRAEPRIAMAWCCYLLAALSKELAIIFPVLAVLLEWPATGEGKPLLEKRRLVFFVGLALCTLVFLLIRFHWMKFPFEGQEPRLGGSLLGTLLADIKIQARYLLLFVAPWPLRSLYPESLYTPALDVVFWISLLDLLVVAALMLRFRRSRIFMMGMLWWFISMAPVANIYPLYNPMAERYTLWPSIGLCLWAGWALHRTMQTRFRVLVIGATVAATAAMAVIVVRRNPVWHDDLTVWSDAARFDPDHPTVLANLAAAHYGNQDYARTIEYAGRALERHRAGAGRLDRAPSLVALGSAHFMLQDIDAALRYFHEAEKLLPVRFDVDMAVYYNLGLAYEAGAALPKALTFYRQASDVDPFREDLWRKIAFCEIRLEKLAQARAAWQRAKKLRPDLPAYEQIQAAYDDSVARERAGPGGTSE